MRVVDEELGGPVRRQLLPEDQLRDRERVEGPAGGGVEGGSVVLDGGLRLEHHQGDLGVLHIPFELHPPVLEPCPHLRKSAQVSMMKAADRQDELML